MKNEITCAYCNMDTTTPYGTRGKTFGGGMIYSFISNSKFLTYVSGSSSGSKEIKFCPMCGKELS